MSEPTDWTATAALARLSPVPWRGTAWRAHRRRYRADDPGGALRVSGRYNRGLDQFPENECWPALYLGLGPEICIGEVLRHISPDLLPQLNDYRLSELGLELDAVLDCRDLERLALSLEAIC